ncbi:MULTISPECIES: MJ1255/VC2487 family glycosyltransferase [Pseudoalteromonas]|uniref:Glycosyltransferase n=1 Tax=Pseudoalteromonas amylolytica TaxID=1859457 RepID=A0A1S1MM97_9GAMM|nr:MULTISPECIES: MJ1255/VC2487 family glycosyltransferase [Pseudoalteromonas]OHU86372.1 glycosyltransferase [Pseudoalteromonas sp. JW3]OHU89523.1 glycosyltransferase [Pseudoalteromonas amylolytica]
MKILYGVQGTGNGHTTRARIMAASFAQLGVEVDYFFSGRARDKYFDMDVFGNYQSRDGLSFASQNGQVDKFETLKRLKLGKFIKDVRKLNLSKYDLVFNDFEPITAWAAKLAKVPVIAMSHQASFLFPEVPLAGGGFFTRHLMKQFAPADIHLGVHWQPFAKNIIPPFIPYKAPDNQCQSIANKVLVYLPFEELSKIMELLRDFPDKEFYCYHPDAQNQSLSNVHLRTPSRSGFLKDLANTSGIVANAGFELSSEAMKFGKKLLLKPLSGQFEQLTNALTLENMGRAKVMHYLSSNALEEFLELPMAEVVHFPSDPAPLVNWLINRQWHDVDSLHHQLWLNVGHASSNAA